MSCHGRPRFAWRITIHRISVVYRQVRTAKTSFHFQVLLALGHASRRTQDAWGGNNYPTHKLTTGADFPIGVQVVV